MSRSDARSGWLASLVAALLLPTAAAPAAPAAPDEVAVLAWVDGDSVTTADLDYLLEDQRRTAGSAAIQPEGVLRRLIQNRLVEHEGYRNGAHERPEIKGQVRDLRSYRAMIALLDSVSAEVPDPDPEEFSSTLDQTSEMIRVSHILVGSESFAKILLDSLQAGVPFDELAAHRSLDTARAESGGDLGWGRAEMYIPEFRAALEGLDVGEIAGPVETDEGWHLLTVTDTRTETVGQSEEMRRELLNAVKRERVMEAVRAFVETLREKYGVTVNDSLVTSLDYGSSDPEVYAALKDGEEVIAVLPWREIRVKDLTRRLRFEHFHGIEGKPHAGELRDKVLDEWLIELVLRYEAGQRGYHERPEIVRAAQQVEREEVRESVIKMIAEFRFDPTPDEVEGYYDEHRSRFTAPPRLRAEGAALTDEESARRFREKLEEGAKMRWLAERTPEVRDADPPLFDNWVSPEALGLAPGEAKKGTIVGPLPLDAEEGWGIAQITQVETPDPLPLESCRDQVLAMMRRERTREEMTRALERLEAEAEIEIVDGAEDLVALRIDEWMGTSTTPERPEDASERPEGGAGP